jgi:hypothetical protein
MMMGNPEMQAMGWNPETSRESYGMKWKPLETYGTLWNPMDSHGVLSGTGNSKKIECPA